MDEGGDGMDSLEKVYHLEVQVELLKQEVVRLKEEIEKERNAKERNVEERKVEERKAEERNVEGQAGDSIAPIKPAVATPLDKSRKAEGTDGATKPPAAGSAKKVGMGVPVPTPPRTNEPPWELWARGPQVKNKKANIGMEDRIGKYIMGVLASLLIFMALYIFVSMIYSRLTETMKMVGVYAISTAVLAVGLWVCRRRKSAFTMSVLGCGMGAYYLSFLLTRLYFQRIDDYTLFLLVAVWLAGAYLLSRRYPSSMFVVIEQLGILMAVVFGSVGVDSHSKLNFLTFFFIVTSIYFWHVHEKEVRTPILVTMALFNLISACCLSLCIYNYQLNIFGGGRTEFNEKMVGPALLVFAYFIYTYYLILRRFIGRLEESVRVVLILAAYFVTYLQMAMIASRLFPHTEGGVRHMALFIILIALWVMAEFFSDGIVGGMVLAPLSNAFMLGHLFSAMERSGFVADFVKIFGLFPWYAPLLAIGLMKKGKHLYKEIGFFIVVCNVQLFAYQDNGWVISGFLVLLTLGFFLYGMYVKREEGYREGYKVAAYLITLWNVYQLVYKAMPIILPDMMNASEIIDWSLFASFLVVAALNISAFIFGFARDWSREGIDGGEDASHAALRLVNAVLWVVGMELMHAMDAGWVGHAVLVAVSAVLCCLGVREAVERRRSEPWLGFYLGAKFTLYLIVVMKSYQPDNAFLTSLVCIGIAVASVLVGFRSQMRSFRLYGLILAMVGTAKLVLLDIHYDDSTGKMISYLLCGILCFGINMIYNSASKKMMEKTHDEGDEGQ